MRRRSVALVRAPKAGTAVPTPRRTESRTAACSRPGGRGHSRSHQASSLALMGRDRNAGASCSPRQCLPPGRALEPLGLCHAAPYRSAGPRQTQPSSVRRNVTQVEEHHTFLRSLSSTALSIWYKVGCRFRLGRGVNVRFCGATGREAQRWRQNCSACVRERHLAPKGTTSDYLTSQLCSQDSTDIPSMSPRTSPSLELRSAAKQETKRGPTVLVLSMASRAEVYSEGAVQSPSSENEAEMRREAYATRGSNDARLERHPNRSPK